MTKGKNKKRNELMIKDFKQGLSIDEISKRHNITKNATYLVLHRGLGEEFKLYHKPLTRGVKIDVERNNIMIGEYKQGIEINKIAMKYNITTCSVNTALKKYMGEKLYLYFKSKNRKAAKNKRNKSIVNDYLGNLTSLQISEKYGIKYNSIRKIVYETMGDKYRNKFIENSKLKNEQNLEKFMQLAKKLNRIPKTVEIKSKGIGSYNHHSGFRKTAKQAGYKYMKQVRKKKHFK